MSDLLRYIERFNVADPGQWFRIMPVGHFNRFGRDVSVGKSEIADMQRNFQSGVPETGVPITLEHESQHGKVGDIAALECRDDGLYARIAWMQSGLDLLAKGAFQFFSPEIVWGEMDHEGGKVQNILMGLSLVNSPYFGKATALFSLLNRVEDYREFSPEQRRELADEGKAMPDGSFPIVSEQDLQNAISAWGRAENQAAVKRHIVKRAGELGKTDLLPADWEGSDKETSDMANVTEEVVKGLTEFFGAKPPKTETPPTPVTETAEYKALDADKQKLEAKIAEQEKAQRATANVEKYSTALKVEKFEAPKGLAEKFAAVAEFDAELADQLVTETKALIEQAAQGKLFAEIGTNQPGAGDGSEAEQFLALAKAKAAELKIDITAAYALVAGEQPKLYEAYTQASSARGAKADK